MRGSALGRTLALMMGGMALAGPAAAQTGSPSQPTTPGSPFVETSAGRALQRITYGNFDQSGDFAQVFRNGSYETLRVGGCPAQASCPSGESSQFFLNRLVTQSMTFPLASPAGSFAFTWKEGSEPTLDSEFLGPFYAERAMTVGKSQASISLGYQRNSWASMNDSPIRNNERGFNWGDYKTTTAGRSYVARSRMNMHSDIATLGVNLGITPKLDIRALVPVVHTTVEGSNEFIDFNVDSVNRITAVGAQTGLTPQGRYYVKGESTGVGDIDLGVKFAVLRQGSSAVSLTGGVRLGTGSADKLTGTGETSGYAALVSSFEWRWISPAFEVGYRFAGDSIYDELDTRVGISLRAIPNRVTLTAEYVGRRVFNVRNIFPGTVLAANVIVPGSSGAPYDLQQYDGFFQDISLFLVGGGIKVRLTDHLVATGYALFPTGSQGLQPETPVWSVGLNFGY